ncbi:MAG: hypothetical protein A2Y95_08910 [Deltaproteobacteria bacterium RBG_13_65_10]|jgi:TorA maturation chaperone TorD|nr:MAG: hypothetical protein A2Y95_08910 [Deltaproteobacteria bacterium RBG_13_65_10]
MITDRDLIEARRAGADERDYLRAQNDFLDRHLLNWFPKMTAKLKRGKPLPFYAGLAETAFAFFKAEKEYLAAII